MGIRWVNASYECVESWNTLTQKNITHGLSCAYLKFTIAEDWVLYVILLEL